MRVAAIVLAISAAVAIYAYFDENAHSRENAQDLTPAIKLKRVPPFQPTPMELSLRTRETDEKAPDMFASTTWQPTAPSPATPAMLPVSQASAKPVAPPLPLKYVGALEVAGRVLYLLQNGEKNVVITEGDVIDGSYQFDGSAADGLAFTYLPLGEKQMLALPPKR